MEAIGKFQVYYEKINTEVMKIREKEGYTNSSKAFTHWFLEKFEDMNSQDIAESIIDGDGDNGIDAIVFLNDSLRLYQFKFPDKVKNIDKAIDETTVLKLHNGYKKLTSNRKPKKANEIFLHFYELIKEKSIFSYEFIFVSYGNGLSEHANDSLSTVIDSLKQETGNEIKYQVITKKKICDRMDKAQKKYAIDIQLRYARLDPSYNLEQESNSWSGFANAKDILSACKDVMDVIFDENIRLYEGNVPVNIGIRRTAIGSDSKYFCFFNNGIVFICDKCNNSTGNQNARLLAASVVNGCQTIVTLQKANDDGLLQDDVFIPIRIIETEDFDLRAKITEYLNSQSKIKDSYFLANNTFVKDLQNQLLDKDYFLERLFNEYEYKFQLKKINEYPKDKILKLEKTIQIYVAFYINDSAAIAKRGKNDLFNRDVIDSRLCQISADRVLCACKYYQKISDKITLYRKCRRSKNKNVDFLEYIGINVNNLDDYDNLMNKYAFLNTGDLLLLNAFSNLQRNLSYQNIADDALIKEAIEICSHAISLHMPKTTIPSAATKSSAIFLKVQEACSANKVKTN